MSHTPLQQVVGLPGQVVQGQVIQGQLVASDQVTSGQMIMTSSSNLSAIPQQQFVNQLGSSQSFQGNIISNASESGISQSVTELSQIGSSTDMQSMLTGQQVINQVSSNGSSQKQPLITQPVPPPSPTPGLQDSSSPVITKQRIADLVREVDPNEQLDDDVEELLMLIGDDFIESVANAGCRLAKHRGSRTLEVRDVQMHLERNWNMWIPGFGNEELKPHKRAPITEAHKQRLALLRKAVKKY